MMRRPGRPRKVGEAAVTRPTRTIRRLLALVSTAALLGLGMIVTSASPASAGGCNWYTPCGEVTNNSSWGMHVTTTLGSGPHYCDVWNWNGGSTWVWKHAQCTQEYLAPGSHKGGGSVDVDAFTFNTRDYMLNFHGSWSWKTKGVWTKIQNVEGAHCYTDWDFYVPKCYVVWE
jgi:hypothetical protein